MSRISKAIIIPLVWGISSSCSTEKEISPYDFSYDANIINTWDGCGKVDLEFYENVNKSARLAFQKREKPMIAVTSHFIDKYGDIRDKYFIYGLDDLNLSDDKSFIDLLNKNYGFLIFDVEDTCMTKNILYQEALPVYNKELFRLIIASDGYGLR